MLDIHKDKEILLKRSLKLWACYLHEQAETKARAELAELRQYST